jgi:sec-independent protein translocase protein TatC
MPTLDDAQNSPLNPESTSSQPVAPEAPVESALVQVGRPATPLEEQAWDPDAHAEQEAIRAHGSNGSGGYSGGGSSDSSDNGASGEESSEGPEGKMSFLDHLEELRGRIINSVIAAVVGFFASWYFREELYAAIAWPITSVMRELNMPDKLVYTTPTGVFTLYVQMCMVAGLILAMPYLLLQVWGFISPGLYPRERRYAIPFIFMCSVLFLSGAAFAYFVAFPSTLRFLLEFSKQFTAMITVNEYFSLAIMIILGLALVFELPVLILFLTMLRIVTPGFLLSNFRYALLLIFLLSAVITPTPDVPTMMLFAAPLTGLYFLGIGMSSIVVKMRKKREEEAS